MRENRLYLKIDNENYYAGSIRVIPEKLEMFFHFPWGSKTTSEYQKFGESKIDNWNLPDHISFHSDGKIHKKLKGERDKKIYLQQVDCKMNFFNLNKANFLPLYLESFHLDNEGFMNQRFKPENPTKDCSFVWNVQNCKHFSLIFISKCGNVHPEWMVKNNLGLKNLTFLDQPIVIQKFFTKEERKSWSSEYNPEFDTELMILVVKETISQLKEIEDSQYGTGINVNALQYVPSLNYLSMLKNINI
ncbi:MAG: hypothetical protein GYB35_14800 [Algicola sp.]|nr:hypothetical protein [Algicola sp.]